MVVLSGAICTKSGKALMSRQFVEMTRIRIEGLLAAFPKLLSTDGKQHTYVETESVRYVYQPMDNLYLLLITNRASNIIEDLETLRLLSKVVPDVCGTSNNLNEERVTEKCFELIFAFDEVITAGGYREPVTLPQIRTNLEMESHEEKLHNMIKVSKMESARDQARDAARTIRDRQREQARLGISTGMAGIGGGGIVESLSASSNPFSESRVEAAPSTISTSYTPTPSSARAPAVKGMSLSTKGAKNKSLEEMLVKEDKLAPMALSSKPSASSGATESSAPVSSVIQQPVMLAIVETVSCKLTRDGMVESFDIKGNLNLTATADESALCNVQLHVGDVEDFTFNTHPKINKALYDQSVLLQLKDATKGFPTARPLGILRWAFAGDADDAIPLKINCWPEEESRGQMNVSIEYTMDLKTELHDVRIRIPLGTHETPSILNCDGNYKVNSSTSELVWEIPLIDQSNNTGSLEFNIAQKSADAFFPVVVQFSSKQLFCNIEVASVRMVEGGAPILYGLSKDVSTEEYTIG